MKILRPKGLGISLLALFLSFSVNALKRPNCRDWINEIFTLSMPLTKGIPIKRLLLPSGSQTLGSWRRGEILGFVRDASIYKEAINALVPKIRTFEQYMLDLGFDVPRLTRIVIFDKRPIWPRRSGVYALPVGKRLANIVQKPNNLMVIDLLNLDDTLSTIRDYSMLLHEHSHNFLNYKYRRDAFINSSISINEAFADFLPAHYRGDPAIGAGLGPKGRPIRDIEKKIFSSTGVWPSLTTHLRGNEYVDSIHYSNALWEMRKELGASVLSSLIKDFLENLNFYRHSFVGLQKKAGGKTNRRKKAVEEFEYFLAVFKRTVMELNGEENVAKVDQVTAKIADQLKLDDNRIDHVTKNIFKNHEILYNNQISILYFPGRQEEITINKEMATDLNINMAIDGLILAGAVSATGGGMYLIYERVFNSLRD